MNAMYEKKLALQAESYIQLKIAYEELSQESTGESGRGGEGEKDSVDWWLARTAVDIEYNQNTCAAGRGI